MKKITAIALFATVVTCLAGGMVSVLAYTAEGFAINNKTLRVEHDEQAGTISVFRAGDKVPILTQNAREDTRPYIHPIVAPDGKGLLTEYRPKHHLHQTGLYWGLKLVNGRDYFMN